MAGALLGAGVTAAFASYNYWAVVVPTLDTGAGIAAALLIGGIAGVYPAWRAARLSPTEALRSV